MAYGASETCVNINHNVVDEREWGIGSTRQEETFPTVDLYSTLYSITL